jgi:general stress protein 26
MDGEDNHARFIDAVKGFRTAMLITHGGGGRMNARPMAVAELRPDGDTCFATSMDAPKVQEIEQSPAVTVTFQSSAVFARLTGTATLTCDRALIDRLWSEAWRVWWPKGKDDPSIVLIRVAADEGEYWDNAGVQGIKYAFEAAKAYLKGERPAIDPGVHGTTKL